MSARSRRGLVEASASGVNGGGRPRSEIVLWPRRRTVISALAATEGPIQGPPGRRNAASAGRRTL